MRGRLGRNVRRSSTLSPVVEGLESRCLLSGMAPGSLVNFSLAGSPAGVGEIGAIQPSPGGAGSTSVGSGGIRTVNSSGTVSPGNLNTENSAADAQADLLEAAAARATQPRRASTQVWTGGAGAGLSHQTPIPLKTDASSPTNWGGPASGSRGMAGSATTEDPGTPGEPGPINEHAPGEGVLRPASARDGRLTVRGWQIASARESEAVTGFGSLWQAAAGENRPTRTGLDQTGGDGAGRGRLADTILLPDWEMLRHELRQLVARMSGTETGASAQPKTPWPTCLVVLAALVTAREAVIHRRNRRGRLAYGARLAGASPCPFGPWPLGPP
jgi:hypothetical protein